MAIIFMVTLYCPFKDMSTGANRKPEINRKSICRGWKMRADDGPHFRQPLRPLFRRAGDDDSEGAALDVFHTAQIENAFFPKRFQRIAKDSSFSFVWRVGGVKNDRRLRFEQ